MAGFMWFHKFYVISPTGRSFLWFWRLFPLGLLGMYFDKRHYPKLIPDLLPHRGSGVLSSLSPPLSLSSTWSMKSILTPSNKLSPVSFLNSVACGHLEALLTYEIIRHLLYQGRSILFLAPFALPGTSYITYMCSVNWIWADFSLTGTLGVSELQLGKRLLTGEFLYADDFTLFTEDQPRVLLNSNPPSSEAEEMMGRRQSMF